MRAVFLAVLFAALAPAAAHAQQTPPACDPATARPIALDTEVSIDNRIRYEVPGTQFAFCVERASYPYSSGHGHSQMIVVRVYFGRDESRFVVGRGQYISWKHFRIDARLDRPHFTEDCGVAVRLHHE